MTTDHPKAAAREAAAEIKRIWREAIPTRRGTPQEENQFLCEQILERDEIIRRLRAELASLKGGTA